MGIFGWWMFRSTNQLANELHQESKFSGQSAGEYSDVKDFLEVTRGIVVSFEVYPQNYEGIFGVTWDRFTAAKIGLNQISDQYLKNYPQSMHRHPRTGPSFRRDSLPDLWSRYTPCEQR